ncbi:MAG TPA: ABC transporter permease [Candidatus Deferrimicrobium sp.]|nr:ABC transporter permease [Candidatus Deferrimicrobium sp.]
MKFILDIKKFARLIYDKKGAIYELAKRDFEAQYKSTYLGMVWGFVHPLSYVLVLLLVFTIGLRSNPGKDIPFVVYLISGMIPWQFFTTVIMSLTKVVHAHSYLVKKGNQSLAILHVAKILSNLLTHVILIIVCFIVCLCYGFPLGFHSLQIFYYMLAMCLLLLGLGWITSATSIFIEDIANVITILVQFGFWFTPIIWNISIIPRRFQWIVKLNPACYIVSGYRDSLIYGTAPWEKSMDTLYFWVLTAGVLLTGAVIFRRLKPHFGEVI